MTDHGVPLKRILLVDDVELFLQLEITFLGNGKFELQTARTGKEALEKAKSFRPDLILLDLFMPDMTGDEVCRILKSEPETASVPVFLISSGGKDESRRKVKASGCDGLIYKPIRKDLLLSIVDRVLGTGTRHAPRARVEIPATVAREEKEWAATIHSLSPLGAFIETEEESVIIGDLLNVRFSLPESGTWIEARTAAVVWLGCLGEGGPWGAGVQFLGLFPGGEEQIRRYVESRPSPERKGSPENAMPESAAFRS